MTNQEIIKIALLLSPFALIQLGMVIYALVDLARRTSTRGPRWAWALGMIVTAFGFPTGVIVAGIYLGWGRHGEG